MMRARSSFLPVRFYLPFPRPTSDFFQFFFEKAPEWRRPSVFSRERLGLWRNPEPRLLPSGCRRPWSTKLTFRPGPDDVAPCRKLVPLSAICARFSFQEVVPGRPAPECTVPSPCWGVSSGREGAVRFPTASVVPAQPHDIGFSAARGTRKPYISPRGVQVESRPHSVAFHIEGDTSLK